MKKNFFFFVTGFDTVRLSNLFFVILFIAGNAAVSQTYIPFPTENAQWVINYCNPDNFGEYCEKITGDTMINSKLYTVISKNNCSTSAFEPYELIREEDHVIYRYYQDSQQEYAEMDFNLNIGDTFYYPPNEGLPPLIVDNIGYIAFDDSLPRRYLRVVTSDSFNIVVNTWIEGVGNFNAPVVGNLSCYFWEIGFGIICFIHNYQYIINSACYFEISELPDKSLKVFPNPVNSEGTIQIFKAGYIKELVINGIDGKLVYSKTINDSDQTYLRLAGISPGCYILCVIGETGTSRLKLVVTK